MNAKKNFHPTVRSILRSCSWDLMSHYCCVCDDISFMTSQFISYICSKRFSFKTHNGAYGDELVDVLE